MVVAIYKQNRACQPEHIRVHKYANGELHIEAISISYAHEVGGTYLTLDDVEEYLANRDRIFGYKRIFQI